jgi:hypothetical protein
MRSFVIHEEVHVIAACFSAYFALVLLRVLCTDVCIQYCIPLMFVQFGHSGILK